MKTNNSKLETMPEHFYEDGLLKKTEKINLDLLEHQCQSPHLDKKNFLKHLNSMAKVFVFEFKLKTTVPAIMLDSLNSRCYGHFRLGRNGFGLLNEIAINQKHVNQYNHWHTYGTLLHELIHAEQEQSYMEEKKIPRTNNYHDKAFRQRALSLGLIVDQWGHTKYSPAPSPFLDVLDRMAIKYPQQPSKAETCVSTISSKYNNSKLKPWICSCKPNPVHVRVAVEDFRARCLKCGQMFVRK